MNTRNLSTTTLITIIIAALVIAASPRADAAARRFVIGASPSLAKEEREAAWAATLEFIVHGMKPGDALAAYDAAALQPIATLEIPADPLFEKPNPRLTRLAAPLGRLKAFFARDGGGVTVAGTVMAPQFLDLVARQLRREGEAVTVILLAAPWYADSEQAFDFGREGAFPSDGFLRLPASESPFSTIAKARQLAGVTLHWTWLREPPWAGDAHRQGVTRFWHLFASTQGGVLASAAADAKTVFRRAGEGAAAPVLDAVPDTDAKAEMILIRHRRAEAAPAPEGVMAREEGTVVSARAPDWLTRATPTASGPAPARGQVKIGLRWGDNDPAARDIDLDLYVVARPGVKELSYRRMRTPEGWLYKDWLSSPSVANGFETVELTGETNLSQLAVAVNFYAGLHPAGRVNAVLKLWVNGAVYETPLRVASGQGNRGAAAERRATDLHWVVIDIPRLAGLR